LQQFKAAQLIPGAFIADPL